MLSDIAPESGDGSGSDPRPVPNLIIRGVITDNITTIKSAGNGTAYILTGNSYLYKITDYGNKWEKCNSDDPVSSNKAYSYYLLSYGLLVTDRGSILVSDTAGHIFRSTDGGDSFIDLGVISLMALYRFDKIGDGIIINGWSGKVKKSINDGLTWPYNVQLAPSPSPLYATEYLGDSIVLQADEAGRIFRSENNAETWEQVADFSGGADDFAYLGNGVVVYSTYTGNPKYMYRSENSGKTWSNIGTVPTGVDGDSMEHEIYINDGGHQLGVGVSNKGYFLRSQRPIANFTASPTSGPATLDVSFTDHSTGDPTSWLWDFGDETARGTIQNPSHTYTAPNIYTVSLTASNIAGSNTKRISNYITVTALDTTKPTVVITEPLDNAEVKDTITIKANATDDRVVNRVEFYIDNILQSADNTPSDGYEYQWDTTSVTDSNHSIKAIAYDDALNRAEHPINVTVNNNHYPVFSSPIFKKKVINEDQLLTFTVSASDQDINDTLTYSTNVLPRGAVFSNQTFSWRPDYKQGRTKAYPVIFNVSDGRGGSAKKTVRITVTDSIPISANFIASSFTGIAPLSVNFTDLSSSPVGITYWLWRFGDGINSTDQNPSHTYTKPGNYTVSLTVSGPTGRDIAKKARYITVS